MLVTFFFRHASCLPKDFMLVSLVPVFQLIVFIVTLPCLFLEYQHTSRGVVENSFKNPPVASFFTCFFKKLVDLHLCMFSMSMPGVPSTQKGLLDYGDWSYGWLCTTVSAGTSGPCCQGCSLPWPGSLERSQKWKLPVVIRVSSSLSGASRQLPKECLVVLREFTDSVPFLLIRTCTAIATIALGSCGMPLCVNEASQYISPPGANQDLALEIPRCSWKFYVTFVYARENWSASLELVLEVIILSILWTPCQI